MLYALPEAKSEAAPPKLPASNIMWNIIYSHFAFNFVLPGYNYNRSRPGLWRMGLQIAVQ